MNIDWGTFNYRILTAFAKEIPPLLFLFDIVKYFFEICFSPQRFWLSILINLWEVPSGDGD